MHRFDPLDQSFYEYELEISEQEIVQVDTMLKSIHKTNNFTMKTTFEEKEESAKINSSNTWAGFWMLIFMVSAIMACWGTPDLIDAWIYYLTDGYFK